MKSGPDLATFEQLKTWWLMDSPSSASDYYNLDDVAFALSKLKPQGISLLAQSLYDSNEERRQAALYFLAWPEFANSEILQALQAAFASSSRSLRIAALWGFIHLQNFPVERTLIEQLRQHTDERQAALAMVYLSHAYPEESIFILRAALHSPNPREREYACDEIGNRGISELADEIIALRNDPDEDVRRAAESNSWFS